jgi:hypothetical protein
MAGFSNQIENRNFLSSVNFKFSLNRAPKVAFFSNQVSIPSLTLGVATQPNYLNDIPVPGDKMVFDDFTIKFLVDENLENYMEIQNWMRGLGFPESLKEIYDFQDSNEAFEQPYKSDLNLYSDGTLIGLNSSLRFNFQVKFRSMFPVYLSPLEFDATSTDTEYFTADVTFKYLVYNILDKNGNPLTSE